jgi:protein quaking
LLKDKKTLSSMPPLLHVERLLDYEIKKVRAHLFQTAFSLHTVDLPDPQGPTVTLSEKVFVPIKQYPDVSSVAYVHPHTRVCSTTLLAVYSDREE